MSKISAVIITLNEEKYIEQCLKSVKGVVDEIIVVDSFSKDRTKEICLSHGVKFVEHPFCGYRDQKNYALSLATNDYVLALDADEALSPELEQSIHKVKQDLKYDGYKFKRLNNFCGRWIYHTNLSPDCKIRLFNRKKAKWGGLNVHEIVILDNHKSIKMIKGNLLHWLYDDYEESIEKINSYTTLLAAEYYEQNIKYSIRKLIIHPIWRFFHSFILKAGFLDGFEGYTISKILAITCFLKYLKLRNFGIQAKKLGEEKNYRFIISGPCSSDYREKLIRPISIGFDSKRTFYNSSGLGNYSRNLLLAFSKGRPQNSYYLFTPKIKNRIVMDNEEHFKLIEPKAAILKLIHSIWRTKYIINDIIDQNIDIYHGLSQELPAGIKKSGVKSVVTVHDLIFFRYPKFYKWIDKEIYYWKLVHACRVSDSIVAISKQTKSDLVRFLNIPPNKISVIYQGCNSCFWDTYSEEFHMNVRTKFNLPDKYLLYVGTIEERKNLLGIVMAIHIKNIKLPLVIVGRKVPSYYKIVQNYIAAHNMNNCIFLDNVLNQELSVIYRNAECFIYPSFFEGFGIPILEALVSKTPVITSIASCFEEVAGPGSIYIDPYDSEKLGDAINMVISDKALRDRMVSIGTDHAKHFNDDVVVNSYFRLYYSLLQ